MENEEIKKLLIEQHEDTQRYLGAMQEHYDGKIAGVMELVQDIPAIKEKVDLTFDKVGEIAVDVEVVKEVIKDHSRSIAKLQAH